jgi:hypothetical protein
MRKSAVIHFRRNMLDLAGRKPNIRAHDVPDATIECLEPPKFFRQAFGDASVGGADSIASKGDSRYTERPFRPNSMSIPAITCERKGAKAILLFSSANPRKTHLLSELKSFRKD